MRRLDLWLAGLIVAAGSLSIVLILDATGYPYEVHRAWIFHYFLRHQDIAGWLFVMGIALVALAPGRAPLGLVDVLSRRVWSCALIALGAMCLAAYLAARNHPLAGDEQLAIFQSRAFAAGHLTGELPPELLFRLIPSQYQWRWLVADEATGRVASMYWPGFALMLAPFNWIGALWLCCPLLAGLSLVLMARIAERVSGDRRAAGWALLFAAASPGFIGMALSYFSMTAHLFLNLLYVWLLLERTPRRLVAAGVVGSLALVLNNPVPHLLFALPWVLSIARAADGRRDLARLAAGYAPLALMLGFGWWLFLRRLEGPLPMALYPSDEDLLHRIGNLVWHLLLQFRTVFGLWEGAIISRALEQGRLWSWSAPGLVVLALGGWWLRRDLREARLLGWSFAATVLGYLPVAFDQGSGWGARYVHPAFGALPVLAALALVHVADGGRLRAYVARAALYSLVFANLLRFYQIRLFMDDQLSLEPPFEKGARQIVIIVPNVAQYAQDFVLQNDPFLGAPVVFMMSRGRAVDAQTVARRLPGARLVYDGANGQVWRSD